jgi:hypothetical protein
VVDWVTFDLLRGVAELLHRMLWDESLSFAAYSR